MVDRLWVMWRDPQQTRRTIGQLWRDPEAFHFAYEPELPADFRLLPEFPERRTFDSRYLFPTFAERIPNPRRPDYQAILDSWGVEHPDDPFEALARSGGILATDMIELSEWRSDMDDLEEPLLVRVAGTRFQHGAASALPNQAIVLQREPENPHDADATRILLAGSGEPLGCVPRPYTTAIARLLDAGVPLAGRVTRRLGVPNSYGRWVVELRRGDRAA